MDQAAIKRKYSNMLTAAPNPITFVWNKLEITGVRSNITQEVRHSDYGASLGYDFTIQAKRSDFGANLPEYKDSITINGEPKRIIMPVEEDSAGVAVTIHIGSDTD